MVIPSIEAGLDQELSMAKNSHVVKYFDYMAEILSMGPPVYWVLGPGVKFSELEHQNIVCGGQQCNKDSVATKLYLASNFADM